MTYPAGVCCFDFFTIYVRCKQTLAIQFHVYLVPQFIRYSPQYIRKPAAILEEAIYISVFFIQSLHMTLKFYFCYQLLRTHFSQQRQKQYKLALIDYRKQLQIIFGATFPQYVCTVNQPLCPYLRKNNFPSNS